MPKHESIKPVTKIKYKPEDYSYRLQYSLEEKAYLGVVDEFPGLSAFSETMDGALKEIRQVVKIGLELLIEKGKPIPEPLSRKKYSGKFVVRMTPTLHRQLAVEATRKGISLNDLVNEKLSATTIEED